MVKRDYVAFVNFEKSKCTNFDNNNVHCLFSVPFNTDEGIWNPGKTTYKLQKIRNCGAKKI